MAFQQLGIDTPKKIIDGVLTTTTTEVYATPAKTNTITAQFISATAGPTSISLTLLGSLDGTNFVVIGSAITTTTGAIQTINTNVPFIKASIDAVTIGSSTGLSLYVVAKAL